VGREMEGRHESAAAREGKTCSSRACSTEDWSKAHSRKLLSHICFKQAAQKHPCHYFGGLKIKHLQVQRHYSACVGKAPHTSKESPAQHL